MSHKNTKLLDALYGKEKQIVISELRKYLRFSDIRHKKRELQLFELVFIENFHLTYEENAEISKYSVDKIRTFVKEMNFFTEIIISELNF